MREIIHWSDLHIGAGKDRERVLESQVAYVQGMFHPDSCVIFITGDVTEGTLNPFTQRKHWRQMDRARAILEPLVQAGYVLVVVPGNHDHNPRGATFSSVTHRNEFRKRVLVPLMPWTATPWAPDFREEGLRVVGFDSTAGTFGPGLDLARGAFGSAELRRLWDVLGGDQDTLVLGWHHSTEYDAYTNALEDERRVLGAIGAVGGVDFVLQGHEHKERWRQDMPGVDIMFASWRTTDSPGKFMSFNLLTSARTLHTPFVGLR